MKRLWTVMIAVSAAACSDPVTLPRQQLDIVSEIQFLEFSPTVFEQTQKNASFWAVHGQERALVLRYADTGRKYLRFEVGSGSLANWPDGTPFMPGDSVQITMTADPLGRWQFHFMPTGLTFSPSDPAKLTLEYDRVLGAELLLPAVWKRHYDSWELLHCTRLSNQIVRAEIYDFTDFGLAIN